MFKGFGNLMSLMKQAQSIGGRLKSLNDQLKSKRATGSAGGGLVEFDVNGLGEVLSCRLDSSLLAKGDREMLEDLVASAANDAAAKARGLHMGAMQGLSGGVELPGMEDLIAQIKGIAAEGEESEEDVAEREDHDRDPTKPKPS